MRSLSIAATGMQAQQLNVDVISNNIPNITTGYNRRRAEFQDLLYQDQLRVGTNSSADGTIVPAGVQIGLGVKTAAVYPIMQQGTLVETDNKLDLAIQGKGFFQVKLPDGTNAYTRAGSFQLSNTGQIVTANGYVVQPGLTIPSNALNISIDQSGEVMVTLPGQTQPQTVGQLTLATFPNEAGLTALGDNLLQDTQASGQVSLGVPGTPGFGTVSQGFLEQSNVNVVQEITNLI